jgi:hypothetical protein
VSRLAIAAAGAAALALSAAACGGGDGPVDVDNACGFRDGEPNNNAEGATTVDVGAMFTGCLETADADYLSIQSPADGSGGYVQATIGEASGAVRVTIYDDTGTTELGSFVADAAGAPLSFYWASGAGQQTRIAVTDEAGGGTPYAYQLTTSYTAVADPFEPNDAMTAAAAVPDGGQMSAYLFAGRHDATNDPAAYDDYYRFQAQPGAVAIRLDDVPSNLAARVFVFRTDGTEVARVSSGVRGGALVLNPPTVVTAEDFVVRVSVWDIPPAGVGAGTELPASFTQAYRLSVSQP